MSRLHKPYRPSNGTEGEGFISATCGTCERSGHHGDVDDVGEDCIGCSIAGRTFMLDVGDPEYPTEWIVGARGPECTAWVPIGDPIPTPRCTATADMFSQPGPGSERAQ